MCSTIDQSILLFVNLMNPCVNIIRSSQESLYMFVTGESVVLLKKILEQMLNRCLVLTKV